MKKARRRQFWVYDDLWERAERAAEAERKETGRYVSTAEWIRQAMEEKLEKTEDAT